MGCKRGAAIASNFGWDRAHKTRSSSLLVPSQTMRSRRSGPERRVPPPGRGNAGSSRSLFCCVFRWGGSQPPTPLTALSLTQPTSLLKRRQRIRPPPWKNYGVECNIQRPANRCGLASGRSSLFCCFLHLPPYPLPEAHKRAHAQATALASASSPNSRTKIRTRKNTCAQIGDTVTTTTPGLRPVRGDHPRSTSREHLLGTCFGGRLFWAPVKGLTGGRT